MNNAANNQPEDGEEDLEVTLMQWMSVDQLDRYSDVLQTIEREKEAVERLKEQIDPKTPLMQYPGAFESFLRLMAAEDRKILIERQLVIQVGGQLRAWEKLGLVACKAIESLVSEGSIPNTCGGSARFFSLMYQQILKTCGASIKEDSDFRQVQIMQFLKKVLVNRLPQFALEYRERGQPVVAQVMEELAEATCE
jgi:hypothetical protein